MDINGQATPVDLRMPGYPAFLALVYALTGRTGEAARVPVMLAQVLVDLATCVVIAALAAMLVRLCGQPAKAKRVFLFALWLAALCPFTANYVAVPLTEVWAVFLTAVAFLAAGRGGGSRQPAAAVPLPARQGTERAKRVEGGRAGGIRRRRRRSVRPETPLVLITTFAWRWHSGCCRAESSKRWLLLCFLMCMGCALPLVPWTIRNAITLHEFQPLTPKDTTLPSELDPKGFMAWEKTWLYRVRDNYLVAWKLNDDEIHMEDIPDSAFDTPEERERVATILDKYNDEITWTRGRRRNLRSVSARANRPPSPAHLSVDSRQASRAHLVYSAHRIAARFRPRVPLGVPARGRSGRPGSNHPVLSWQRFVCGVGAVGRVEIVAVPGARARAC